MHWWGFGMGTESLLESLYTSMRPSLKHRLVYGSPSMYSTQTSLYTPSTKIQKRILEQVRKRGRIAVQYGYLMG